MNPALLDEALKLTPSERLELIDVLWDTLELVPTEEPRVSDYTRAILDERLADLEANPGDESSWSDVKRRLEQRRG